MTIFAFFSEHSGRPRAAGAGDVRPLAALRGHDRGQRHRQRPRHHGRPQVAQHEKGTGRARTTWHLALCLYRVTHLVDENLPLT